eukprot:scaffold59786_cov98-Cyclotella_meneghiniana.AAC.1
MELAMHIQIELPEKVGRVNRSIGRVTANGRRFDEPWDPNKPIDALFDRLEDCYIFAMQNKPPFTLEQMIDKAISTAIQCQSVEHMELARHIQIELPEKALCSSRKAELS